ncbi:tetratricopeptide repeat protein [Nocardia sp. NBC_01327]|uniref:tetratricopeptide repeat protein n=1 Tax=Nocardia sp. NBC_01327 TaxID=2903593 RepID=UPI002E10AF11|nr:tetratricopeptide repeat protein [Nocardia sp. NBC_01327]
MDGRIAKARVLMELGRFAGARELLGEVLAGDPENAVALADMAEVAFRLREYARALEFSAAALRRTPEDTFVWRVRALAELALARDASSGPVVVREHRAAAVAAARRAVEIDPENADNLRILAATLRDEDPVAALQKLVAALEVDPDNVGVYLLRGLILRRNLRGPDSLRLAEEAFRAVLRLDPENAEALYELALIDLERGNRTAGEEQLRRVARLDPEYGDAVRENLEWLAREDERLADAARTAAETTRPAGPRSYGSPSAVVARSPGTPRRARRYGWALAALVFLVVRLAAAGVSHDSGSRYTTPARLPSNYLQSQMRMPSFPAIPDPREAPFRNWPSNWPRQSFQVPPISQPKPSS